MCVLKMYRPDPSFRPAEMNRCLACTLVVLVFINDLEKSVSLGKMLLFVHDVIMLCSTIQSTEDGNI